MWTAVLPAIACTVALSGRYSAVGVSERAYRLSAGYLPLLGKALNCGSPGRSRQRGFSFDEGVIGLEGSVRASQYLGGPQTVV